jgi:hypothetical protein
MLVSVESLELAAEEATKARRDRSSEPTLQLVSELEDEITSLREELAEARSDAAYWRDTAGRLAESVTDLAKLHRARER